MRSVLGFAVLSLLLFPFLVLISYSRTWVFPFDTDTGHVFLFTAWQSALSAAVSLVAGVLGGLGLVSLSENRRWGRLTDAFVLLPNAVPSLLVILAALNIYASTRGLWGIVWVHSLLNIGLVATAFARLMLLRVGRMADLAWIEGAGRWMFWRRGVLPYLAPDLARLFLFVFTLCFASFAVPLAVGGSRATTVEVLIYEKVRQSLDWGAALGLAVLQTGVILSLSWFLRGREETTAAESDSTSQSQSLPSPLLHWRPGLLFALGPAVLVVSGLLWRLPAGFTQLSRLPELLEQLPRLFAGSVFVGVGTGLLSIVLLLMVAAARPEGVTRRFLLGFAAPSSVLTGFALLILWRATGGASLVKIVVGLTLIAVPSFYRLYWDSSMSALQGQIIVARTLGASEFLVFRRVVLPQLWRPVCFLGGLSAFWAWGDFALSSVIAERELTVGMVVQGLLGSYRLEAATVLVWLLVLGGTLTFGIFWGAGRVFGARTET